MKCCSKPSQAIPVKRVAATKNCCSHQATTASTIKDIPCECECPCEAPKEKQSFDTTYSVSYTRKPITKDANQIFNWDKKLDAEDSSFIPQQGRYDFPNFFENFSTLYDLSYNHFPRCLGSEIKRKVRQKIVTDEYLPSYGNITKTGLLDILKDNWRCDVQDPRQATASTEIRDNYVTYPLEAYKFRRHAVIPPQIDYDAQLLFLKGGPPLPPKPVCWEERRCNPITWECPWKSF